MNDASWVEMQRLLEAGEAKHLASMIPRDSFARALQRGSSHPIQRLIQAAQSSPTHAVVRATDSALKAVGMWLSSEASKGHRAWWDNKVNRLGDPAANAAGILAEIRAFGTMLSTLHGLPYIPVRPYSAPGKAADFCFDADAPVYVEVCCVRANDAESARQDELDQAEAMLEEFTRNLAVEHLAASSGSTVSVLGRVQLQPDVTSSSSSSGFHETRTTAVRTPGNRHAVFSTSIRENRPQGTDKSGGVVNTVASRIAGKKPIGQIPEGEAGILWMDCCDATWPMSVDNTRPVRVSWHGMNLATTPGIWHSFYGQSNKTPTMVAALLGSPCSQHDVGVQDFDGRFQCAAGRYWSAAVLNCTDGLVVFENPLPAVRLPFSVLKALTALRGYNATASFHRLADEGLSELRATLENVERQLRFCAFGTA